ncbi:MAG: type II toxin-antitoxin system RelE/ParE family toxin [Phycisphaeraceae bacterium]
MVARLTQAARDLGHDPLSGHVVPEFENEAVREYPVWPFRVVYRVSEAGVLILSIVHGSRVMPDDIRDRS